MNTNKIAINILYKDRPTELALLLQSLRTQTNQSWNVYILDDASQTPTQNYHFLNCLINRLKLENHRVTIIRNQFSRGVALNRQALAEHTITKGTGEEFILRLDDDTILEPDYITQLMQVINHGYDIASGVTPPMIQPSIPRQTKFVSPIINRVVLDKEGKFIINCDDCGHQYTEDKILPTHHFRSAALTKIEVHKKVKYENTLTPCGFREEEFFSFKAILAGFRIGVCTQAIAWHLQCPSGGDRRQDYQSMATQNQTLLNRFTQEKFKEQGDFIQEYAQKVWPHGTDEEKYASLNKNTNLIFSRNL